MKRLEVPYCKPGYLNIVAVCLIVLSQKTCGQALINQTNIFIPHGLELHLDGDLANAGFIQNQGSFFVSGNWQNTNVYQGAGRVILNGSLPQSFFNNKNALHHLEVNGEGVKNIRDKLPVTNRLDLVLGVINVADPDTLLMGENATVTGGSIRSHVDGAMTSEGVGYKFFPVGKNGNYYPVEMLNITGINPVTELEVFDNVPSIDLPVSISLFSTVYWQRKTIAGMYINSPVSIGYPVPHDYTNRHVIDILESNALSEVFRTFGTSSVEYGDIMEKVISDNVSTASLFVLGESIPSGGIPGEFYFSTSLSPRASDPDNRFVKVFGNRLREEGFRLTVYNRWGLIVYESTSLPDMILRGWDGRHKGDYLPPGAYPFLLRATAATGETVERKGVISIIN